MFSPSEAKFLKRCETKRGEELYDFICQAFPIVLEFFGYFSVSRIQRKDESNWFSHWKIIHRQRTVDMNLPPKKQIKWEYHQLDIPDVHYLKVFSTKFACRVSEVKKLTFLFWKLLMKKSSRVKTWRKISTRYVWRNESPSNHPCHCYTNIECVGARTSTFMSNSDVWDLLLFCRNIGKTKPVIEKGWKKVLFFVPAIFSNFLF